ncbi:MAG: glycerol-3-phosphate cytidylyltransferase [Bacteroidetes bacterium GWC2_33_15]|nr:MAG: glycerol-3-phosphate cytidylyltransferase [Bacteroidetes bacterium GWA2_33_15]OFX51961.1 MAG: glycerol-3-phosphate cytidylyltransferase [Bacteroidetes bacterium GWC2_33_15]OFX63791.1 MAG: glycerol-3-phosphate cytidylyltransferase [Bacteroidetes bacterium GWB2_32_14]OFX67364.1 MAG: glycerol-3-phosphate cytidylyltransferase [Bacteroidetes bacterium GWD2_33_33]HAN17875.1 D-glycero-beta-D-manno-heptose 1-phosphate adenylyltransferase [Bacteroidales bacterium]
MDKLDVLKSKIINSDKLEAFLAYLRFKNQKIVFTNGCFDIIHRGHIEYLAQAANYGDVLIIGLNTDKSVQRIKGKSRPVQDENARAITLAAMHFIHAVVLFDEDTPYNLIKKVQPDVLIKGSDYNAEDIVGYDIVKTKGGKVITIDFIDGYSTTSIINKLKK